MKTILAKTLFLCGIVLAYVLPSSAENLLNYNEIKKGSFHIAQWEGDDAYDPFADYSEFDDTADEEEDLNFFTNGRLFTLSFAASYRSFTGNLGSIYDSSTGFGFYMTYFFDLRFAMQLGYSTGDYGFSIDGGSATNSATGDVSISGVTLNIKYFINTQNVTRGLANLNPYIVGGLTQFSRELNLDGAVSFSKDSAISMDIGAGIEVPVLRGKMFLGIRGIYHLVKFGDENDEIILNGDTVDGNTGVTPDGDIFSIQGMLGINF